MKIFRGSAADLALCILELAAGILLLLDPVKFTSTVIIGVGVVLIILGLIEVVNYFRTDAKSASLGQMLTKGLISLLAGAFCVVQWQWFLVTFPVLTMVYGTLILLRGISKIQLAIDMVRLRGSGQRISHPDLRHFDAWQALCLHRSSVALYRCRTGRHGDL